MPLGTLDRTPPPFFRQGLSARSKLVFFSALAVFLMAADNRLALVEPLRTALAVVLLPVQRTLAVPVDMVTGGTDYLRGLGAARESEQTAREQLAAVALRATAAEQLARENAQLRALLDLRPALQVRSLAAEVLYEGADPFSRKVFVDRGSNHGVLPGAPVVNAAGVLGQVTRAFPLSSEVTLLADKDAAIPVLNLRTQQRSAAFGGREGGMELRFLPANADVEVGDRLLTSGLDGVYPAGLPVGTVARVERRAEAGFARVAVVLAAQADGVRHVLVLEPMAA
ncbi:MAG: rod shape-determining protein MreC, partial [Rubrivivax sp.]|nr:rod shape-determining protein MreC [Rubrivivax sp.]